MLDANSLIHNRIKSLNLLKSCKEDTPIAGQLLGADPQVMLEAANIFLSLTKITFLDINCACPVKKVIKKRAGAYLLEDKKTLSKIIKTLSSSLATPVTVKMRLGYSRKNLTEIIDTAKLCADSGAAALFIHARTKTQGYSGEVDYNFIKHIKENITVPVFGSGNILNVQLAQKMFSETGCDGILVARGALGRPWIFKNIDAYLRGKEISPITMRERKITLKKHLAYLQKYKAAKETIKMGFMRKVTLWYLKDFSESAKVRSLVCRVKDYSGLLALIDNLPD
jgi:nifR3 family TIM-barrel protein